MKIQNKTKYSTSDLRGFARKVLEAECKDGADRKKIRRMVFLPSKYWVSGTAWRRSGKCVIRIPMYASKEGQDLKRSIASCIAHEIVHCLTRSKLYTTERRMRGGKYGWGRLDLFAYADALPLRQQEIKSKTKEVVTPAERAEKKLLHVASKVQQWEAKQRRVNTALKKWRAKARYHERRLAAMAAK